MRITLAAAILLAAAGIGVLILRPWEEQRSSETRGARVVDFDVESRLLGRSLHEVAVLPAGGGRRPLLVLLHGRGSDAAQWLSDELFVELERLGPRAPAIVVVDGGDHSYYHDRGDGPWGSYVLREAIPAALERTGADANRVAIGGISMGGFGALDLGRIAPRRFCAVGGHSPAVWRSGGETPEGAFDDADDYERHDLFAARRIGRGPVWIDVGDEDPFHDAATELALRLHAQLHVWPGGHSRSYWRAHTPQYLRFYANALARCR